MSLLLADFVAEVTQQIPILRPGCELRLAATASLVIALTYQRKRQGGDLSLTPAVATRSTTPGATCRCLLASPAPCASALPSETGCYPRRWNACGATRRRRRRQSAEGLLAPMIDNYSG